MNKYYQKNKYISFMDAVEDNDSLWVANNCFNGLFKIKKDGTGAEYVASFERDNIEAEGIGLYFYAIPYERKIFFLPYNSFDIAVFDIDTETIKHIYLPYVSAISGFITAGYAFYEGFFYLFPQSAKCDAVRIHIETYKIEKLKMWDEIVRNYHDSSEKYIIASAMQIDSDVWIGVKKTNKLLRYSLQSGLCEEELECEREIVKELGNVKLQELYIISPDGDRVECISLKDQEKRTYIDLGDFIEEGNRILHILSDEKEFIMIPFQGKYIIIVDRKSGSITKHQDFPKKFENFDGSKRFFYTGRLTEEFIELFPYNTNGIIRIHRKSGETKLYTTEIKGKDSVDDLVLRYHYNNSINESNCYEKVYPLESFLDILVKDNSIERKNDLNGGNGRKIVQYILHD